MYCVSEKNRVIRIIRVINKLIRSCVSCSHYLDSTKFIQIHPGLEAVNKKECCISFYLKFFTFLTRSVYLILT